MLITSYFWIGYVWCNNLSDKEFKIYYFLILVGIDFISCFLIWSTSYIFIKIAQSASKILHKNTLISLLRSNLEFLENTSIFSIKNLFHIHLEIIEKCIPKSIYSIIINSLKLIAIILTISIVTPLFALCFLPVLSLFIFCEVSQLIKTGFFF